MTLTEYMDPELLPKCKGPKVSRRELAEASDAIKTLFEERLREELNLFKHSSPLAFVHGSGVNDDLDGSKENAAVLFHVSNLKHDRGIASDPLSWEPEKHGFDAEVVQSLAKWKRVMLKRYSLAPLTGLFCESTSIRKGYKGDVTHSNVCDQWDWEVAIGAEHRNLDFLKATVRKIYGIVRACEAMVATRWPALQPTLPEEITFVTAEELHERWPQASVHERENAAVREWGAVFIVAMGWPMRDGSAPEEVRAPDYDDWTLNGDIMVRHPLTGYRHELSSMGIRVDATTLRSQLKHRGMLDRMHLAFHDAILQGKLPLSMGGGVGVSRLLMLLLQRGHIGEVQVGVWADAHHLQARKAGLDLIPDRIVDSVDNI